MTAQEVKFAFEAKYKIECIKRGIQQIELTPSMILLLISQAQQHIQRKLKVISMRTIIKMDGINNTYNLPSNFGDFNKVFINGYIVDPASETQITMSKEIGCPTRYAVITSGHISKILFNTAYNGITTICYYPDFNYYSPSNGINQDWCLLDSDGILVNNLYLPNRYNLAIIYYMLGEIFNDYAQIYREELASLKETKLEYEPEHLDYNFGGFEDKKGEYGKLINLEETSVDTTEQLYKLLKIGITHGSPAIITQQFGFTETFTNSNITENPSTGVISIVSNLGEFEDTMYVTPNNQDIAYSLTNSLITLTPPSADFGTISITIKL